MAHTSTFYSEKSSTTGFDRNDISAPKSIKEAEIMLEKTRIELIDINEQLAIKKIDEAIDVFDDNEYLSCNRSGGIKTNIEARGKFC